MDAETATNRFPAWWNEFHNHLVASGGNHTYAHHRTATTPKELDEAIREFPHQARRLEEVPAIIQGTLVATAFERAVYGWEEPVFYEGEECGAKRKFSDADLGKLLAALVPEFRKVRKEVDGRLSPEEIRLLAEDIRKLREDEQQGHSRRSD